MTALAIVPDLEPCAGDIIDLTAPELAEHLGVSYRRLHYWLTAGVLGEHLATSGSGVPRHLDADDVRAATAAVAYVNVAGTNTGVMSDVARAAREHPDAAWLVIAEGIVVAATDSDDLAGVLTELPHCGTILVPLATT